MKDLHPQVADPIIHLRNGMASTKRLTQIQFLTSALLSAVVIAAAILAYNAAWFKRTDYLFYDMHFHLRGHIQDSGTIVLVLMNEKSATALGRKKGNWSRRHLAAAIDNLTAAGAEIIGLDLLLSAGDFDPQSDLVLSCSISEANNVILARVSSAFGDEIEPLPIFQEGMIGDGFIDVPLDEDEVLRKVRFFNAKPLQNVGLQLIPAFSLELARAFLNIDFELDFSPEDHFRMGPADKTSLLLPYPELLINYLGDYTIFNNLPYSHVVTNQFPKEAVAGKLVIIGSSLATQKDFFTTPFSRFNNSSKQYENLFGTVVQDVLGDKEPGVSCHAHAVETILTQAFIRKLPFHWIALLIFLAGCLGSVFYIQSIRIFWEIATLFGSAFLIISISHLLFLEYRLWMDISPLLFILTLQFIAGIFLQKAFSRKKAAIITDLFGKYVSPGIVSELLKGDINTTLAGKRENLTVLFSDLRNFTSLSENLGAKSTSNLLNAYFDVMIPLVFENNGTLDKLMGDAVMAFFGAPVAFEGHPEKAATTALKMLDALENLKRSVDLPGVQSLEVGIGLNTGIATVGNLGSHDFMDYTIIGDTVNLASRLEGLNKIYGTQIIVSEFCAGSLLPRFCLRELDRVRVKGKGKPVTILELMGMTDQMENTCLEAIECYQNGLSHYRKKEWDPAEASFFSAIKLRHGDKPSLLYLDRIKQFREIPPEDNWDATVTFTQK